VPVQNDIGFNTELRKWFISTWSATRWQKGLFYIANQGLNLKNVTIDTYSYPDQNNREISHGRLRFYEGSDMTMHANGNDFDSVNIQGKTAVVDFEKISSSKTRIKYNINDMTWTIEADGKNYVTKDIRGKISGTFLETPIRFEFKEPVEFLYSPLIALFGTNLLVK